MLFLAGLESMSKEEMVALLAQLNAITPSRAVSESLQRTGKKFKDGFLELLARGAQFFSASLAARVDGLKKTWDWDPDVIRKSIEEETLSLSQRDVPALRAELRRHLVELGEAEPHADDAKLAQAVILRAAQSLKVPNAEHYRDPAELENAVFEAWLKQLLEQLQKLSLTQTEELEERLRGELDRLSKADQEAMRKALQIEKLSAGAVMSVLKTGASALTAQALVSSFGFGAFLFLATTLKAVGLLFGTTFAFGAYAAASNSLAFLLSPPFLLLLVALTGGAALLKTSGQLDGYKAQLLVVIGRSQLLAASHKRARSGWLRLILQWLSMIWRRFWTWARPRRANGNAGR
jgi:hypothetical protein